MEEEQTEPNADRQRLTGEADTFQKLQTLLPVYSAQTITGLLLLAGWFFAGYWPRREDLCEEYFVFLYLRGAYWLASYLVQWLLEEKHRELRSRGYLDLYRETYWLIRYPHLIISLWNVCYLIIVGVIHQVHRDFDEYCLREPFFPVACILSTWMLEHSILYFIIDQYRRKVTRFNRTKPPPDVEREEWLSSFTQDSYASNEEVGSNRRSGHQQEVLEKQADLIGYLRDHNAKLSRRVLELSRATS